VRFPHVGTLVAVDETPRRDTSPEALAGLKPASGREARITAGKNSSQIWTAPPRVSGSSRRRRLGLEPGRASSRSASPASIRTDAARQPEACAKALARAGLTWDDIAVIEVNEAFASVVLQFARDAGLEDAGTTSTRTAAASRSAIRSVRPAPG
jgi:acetyl-CoA acetyltransferase